MILEIKSIKLIRNDKLVFNKFNLKLMKYQTLILVGDNGSGKSSLMDLIVGILNPLDGKIKINKKNINELGVLKKKVFTYIPHKDSLKENLTIRENLEIWLDLLNISYTKEGFKKKLSFFNLYNGKDINVGNLSHGQRKKVSLTKLLFSNTNLWLLDEPINGLDKKSSSNLIRLINNKSKEGGSIIISSHIDLKIKKSKKIILSNSSFQYNKNNNFDTWLNL